MRRVQVVAGLAALAAIFAFGVVMFGAFVRLSNAGLSCPDWPTCYGQVTWPSQTHEVAHADAAFPMRPVQTHKAWREQSHRFLAGGLGVMVLALALVATWRRPRFRLTVILAAIAAAAGTLLYIGGWPVLSSVLAAFAIAAPLGVAAIMVREPPWRLAVLALAVIVFQAMLGMWTVTWLLKPIVVMGHLLGGMLLFALLSYIALRLIGVGDKVGRDPGLRRLLGLGILLLACQIALGGWTSSNYAAMACGFGDVAFPQCLNQWWPAMNFHDGFILWRGIGVDYEGGVLDLPARTAIQMVHRIGAGVILVYLLWLVRCLVRAGLWRYALFMALALLAQISLGIANVHYGLPLPVATAHNGVAALLLFTLLLALARLQRRVPRAA
ncbi:MAG: COX15/CtaA family protein [Rhodanobacteraceae bacterium]